MATQITATTPRTRLAPRLDMVAVGLLAVIAAAFIGAGIWSLARPATDVTTDSAHYGAGYPLHGGLAGPSRVGQGSTVAGPSRPVPAVDAGPHYGAGYPLDGGLAGPSRTLSAVEGGAHYGAGYPLHGGLAGPSRFFAGD